jgi:ABC-type multidrug transport system ATPase subunit
MISQIIGLMKRRLTYALNDFIIVPLLLLPIAVAITAAVLYNQEVVSSIQLLNDGLVAALYMGAYLGAPGLIAEFIVRERNDKLRNVLTVMGCDFRAYWIGTFLADYLILFIPTVVIWITWPAAGMTDYYANNQGLAFFILLLFNAQLIAFAYFFSFVFGSPKLCISVMPVVVISLIVGVEIIVLLVCRGLDLDQATLFGALLWGFMITTPHGGLFAALMNITINLSNDFSEFPVLGAVIGFMFAETFVFLAITYYTDANSVAAADQQEDPSFDPKVLQGLDRDVQEERDRTMTLTAARNTDQCPPLLIDRLRKVFPAKRAGHLPVVSTEDIAFSVQSGEIFGLLGANGAGKTTTLSMLTRHLVPSSGNAFITNRSILNDFSQAATHLGVVTQNNALWDRLSVEAHLKLFARLRGVPEELVDKVVEGTIDQLELTPHRHKLAMMLSGGMKRKLCVAIALIGDPEVVLLDEPSAGLDPVSRRNLWSVILRTMSHRAVILTTHSMDEAEALCKRIGIMVNGQLRALGTKQHLKNKFGSGYELVVKLLSKVPSEESPSTNLNADDHIHKLTAFVQSLFPSAVLLSDNGSLITYQIPKAEMRVGLAFSQLEEHKVALAIEDYTIAQPTLEQVFIRTVTKYSDFKEKTAGTPMVLRGSARLSIEGTSFVEPNSEDEDHNEAPVNVASLLATHGVASDVNKLGCSRFFLFSLMALFFLLTAIFVGLAFARTGLPGAFIIGVFCFLAMIVTCLTTFCACCQAPKDVDE